MTTKFKKLQNTAICAYRLYNENEEFVKTLALYGKVKDAVEEGLLSEVPVEDYDKYFTLWNESCEIKTFATKEDAKNYLSSFYVVVK